jgi:hypothetical protein
MPIKLAVSFRGRFFLGDPVGQIHRNASTLLQDVTAMGASRAAGQLVPGHGYLTGALHDSIQPRLLKATLSPVFRARGRVIAGARGYERVRLYAGKIEKKYRFMAQAARATQSWVDARRSWLAAILARDLS